MANLMHIAETAVLLFVAYQAGWFVAFFARRLLSPARPAVPAERVAAAVGESAAATAAAAPVVAATPASEPSPAPIGDPLAAVTPSPPRPRHVFTPVTVTPTPPPAVPTLADTAPEASFLSVLEAHDDEDAATPAPKPPEVPVGREAAIAAVRDAIGLAVVEPAPAAAEAQPEGSVAPPHIETPAEFDTAPPAVAAVAREEIVSPPSPEDDVIAIEAPPEADIVPSPIGRPAPVGVEDAFPVSPEPAVPVPAENVEFVFQVDPGRSPDPEVEPEPQPEPPAPPRQLRPSTRPGEAWSGRPVPPSPKVLSSVAEAALDPAAATTPVAAPPPAQLTPVSPAAQQTPPASADAEAEAMRAIEGGWTRRPSNRPAVAAARVGAGSVAQAAPTRPPALLEPREGGKDDLSLIDGLRPADEAALNALGIFHFDQIASWNRAAVEWLELHQIGAGRVTGEKWVEQAQMLASIANSARAIGG